MTRKHYKVSQFHHYLISADWNHIFWTNSVTQQFIIISRIFCEIPQKPAPRKIACVRNPPNFETKNESWFDEGYRAALDDIQEAHREYRKFPMETDWDAIACNKSNSKPIWNVFMNKITNHFSNLSDQWKTARNSSTPKHQGNLSTSGYLETVLVIKLRITVGLRTIQTTNLQNCDTGLFQQRKKI